MGFSNNGWRIWYQENVLFSVGNIDWVYFHYYFYISRNTTILIAQTISVVDIQSLINNNIIYKNTLLKIESDQEKYLKNFDLKEKELNNLFTDIENSKLILNETEIIVQLESYNIKLDNFTNLS